MSPKVFLLSTLIILFAPLAVADTLQLKDGTIKKGIMVESYHDRLVLSTIDGEKEIKRRDIKDINYDRLEQNLVKLGDFHYNKDNLVKALEYYEKAHYANPDYKEAKEKFIHLRSVLLKRPEKKIRSDIDRRRSIFLESGKVYEPENKGSVSHTIEEQFKRATGLVLVSGGQMPKVEMVVADSVAEKAGLKKGDLIFAIWGRLTGYLSLRRVIRTIMESASPEVAFIIKRKVTIPVDDEKNRTLEGVGFSLNIKEDGLTVSSVRERSIAESHGLHEADIITDIGFEQTRYMPLKRAKEKINEHVLRGKVELYILRDIVFWKEE